MATHSKLAPSAAERWINCPASVEMSEQFPDTTSIYAAEGTIAHKLGDIKLRHSILKQQIEKDELEEIYTSEFFSEDMEDYTDEYLVYVRSLIQSPETTVLTETHLDLSFIAPDTGGIADCILVYDDTLHIVDFKYGKNVEVKAQDNPQLMLYALGACKLLDGLIYDIKNVVIHIVQPRMNNNTSASYTKDELYKWMDKTVKPQANKALNNSLEIKVGSWCKFCRAKTICREYAKRYDLDFKSENPNLLTNDEIAQRIKKLAGLDGYLKDLQDYALTHILDGESFPGFKVVAGKSTRTWTNQEEAFQIAQANGFDHSILFVQKPLTLAQVEKVMGRKTFNALLSDYVVKPPGKPTLVPEDDPRESLSSYDQALNDFQDF